MLIKGVSQATLFAFLLVLLLFPSASRAQSSSAATTPSQGIPSGVQAAPVAQGVPPDVLNGVAFPDAPAPVPTAQKITLAQALQTALRDNPQITEATHQVAGARANLSGQRVPLNPTLTFAGVNNTVAPFSPTNPSNYALYYTVETSGRQAIRTQEARAQLQQTQADAQTTHLTVRQATANAYINLQVANQALLNEQQAYATALHLRDLTQKQFQLGAAPEGDAIRADIALTREEQNLINAVGTVKQARANLNIQLGRKPDTPIDTAEPLTYTPVTVQLAQLQQRAMTGRSEIRSAEANERALDATVRMQRSQYYPDVTVGSDLKAEQILVGVTLPIFDFGSIRGSVRKAKEDVLVQRAQIEQTRQQVRLDVQNAYDALEQAHRVVERFEDRDRGILARSESLLQRTEKGYALGASTILDLISAQDTLRSTRNDYYTAIGNYRQAIVQVESAIGQPL